MVSLRRHGVMVVPRLTVHRIYARGTLRFVIPAEAGSRDVPVVVLAGEEPPPSYYEACAIAAVPG